MNFPVCCECLGAKNLRKGHKICLPGHPWSAETEANANPRHFSSDFISSPSQTSNDWRSPRQRRHKHYPDRSTWIHQLFPHYIPMEATTGGTPSYQIHTNHMTGDSQMPQQHWELKMGMQSTGEKMPRESPELTSQSKMRWDHQPPFVIYSLCLATGLEVISEPREKRLSNIPGNPPRRSAPSLHKRLLAQPISGIVLVKAFQSRTGSTSTAATGSLPAIVSA